MTAQFISRQGAVRRRVSVVSVGVGCRVAAVGNDAPASIEDTAAGPACRRSAGWLPTCLLFLAMLLGLLCHAQAGESRKVLVLHSYHQGFDWTDSIQQALARSLSVSSPDAELYVEYMNSKRQSADVMSERLAELYRQAYARVRFDAIVASDNNALDFGYVQSRVGSLNLRQMCQFFVLCKTWLKVPASLIDCFVQKLVGEPHGRTDRLGRISGGFHLEKRRGPLG